MTDKDPDSEPSSGNGSPVANDAVSPTDIRLAAMNLLARREHSLGELRLKLRRRFGDERSVETQLQKLAEQNLQCDERFAESFARQRSGRGYGPARVRQEMRERGISDAAVARAFEAAEIEWTEVAEGVYLKKFGEGAPLDMKEKARRIRFMQYRGFDPDHYQQFLSG